MSKFDDHDIESCWQCEILDSMYGLVYRMLLRVYKLFYSGPEQLTVVPVDCRAAGLTGLQAPVYDVTGSSMTVTWYVIVVVVIMCCDVISTSKDFTVDNNGMSITSIIIMIIVLSCDNDDCRPG